MSTAGEKKSVAQTAIASGAAAARGAGKATTWVGRNVGAAREVSGAGNPGLMRLVDVHASAAAGDALIVIGLLSALFTSVPVTQARTRVAFLLVAVLPFAVLSPLIAPVLDRFRHGRRFAIAASLLGRAVLAWVIGSTLGSWWMYVAILGVLIFNRAYGIARSAALARVAPPSGLRLSQAAARAALFGTAAAGVAALLGAALAAIGPQWALRLASLVFVIGAIIALTLPALADADAGGAPRAFGLPWRVHSRLADGSTGDAILAGGSVGVSVVGAGGLRALAGFLPAFLAFAIRSGSVNGGALGTVTVFVQLGLIAAAFGVGMLLATAIGTVLKIKRPVRLQAVGLVLVALAGALATLFFGLLALLVLCFAVALAGGLAKLAVDATLQARVPEADRATAFARTETFLMLAWIAGAAIGLAPALDTRLGIGLATALALVAVVAEIVAAWRLRDDVLDRPAPIAKPALTAPPATRAIAASPAPYPVAPAYPPAVATQPVVIVGEAVAPQAVPDAAPPGFHVFRPSPPEPEADAGQHG